MTQDEIIEMAIQAELNLYIHDLTEKQYIEVIKHFAKLVAAKERAELTLIAQDLYLWDDSKSLIRAIRARGEA